MNKIAFIGAGNVAGHLATELEHQNTALITQVYSRTKKKAKKLTRMLYEAEPVTSLDFSNSEAQIFILSISDDALSEVIPQLILPEKSTIVHTSGTKSMQLLNRFEHHGVFYPLQTFSQGKKLNFKEIPFCLEASDTETLEVLVALADAITDHIFHITSEERVKLHISAVFACNFTNHLLAISAKILQENQLDFELVKPLVRETLQKALREDPSTVQTGPAIRHDNLTIEKHLEMLEDQPLLHQVYRIMTESIQQFD